MSSPARAAAYSETGPAGIEPAPPVLERTPSDAGVEAFVDFQRLSSEGATSASVDNAGVGTNPGTAQEQSDVVTLALCSHRSGSDRPMSTSSRATQGRRLWQSCYISGLVPSRLRRADRIGGSARRMDPLEVT